MARVVVTEAGFYAGEFRKAGQSYDDGRPEGGEGGPPYEKLTRAELDAMAADRGLDVASASNKGDVIAVLEADDAAKAASPAV